MKRFIVVLAVLLFLLSGCVPAENAEIAATTLPVYEFTVRLCEGTDLQVTRLVTESVSCLHDYTLQVSQMRAIEGAETIVISGAGLEEFLHDALEGKGELCVKPEQAFVVTKILDAIYKSAATGELVKF